MATISNISGNTFLLSFTAAETINLLAIDFSTGYVSSSFLDSQSCSAISSSITSLLSGLTLTEENAGGLTLLLSCVSVSSIDGSINLAESVSGTSHTLQITSLGAVKARVTVAHTVQGGFVYSPQNQSSGGADPVTRILFFGSGTTDLTVSGATTLLQVDNFRNITITGAGVLKSSTGRIFVSNNLTLDGTAANSIQNTQNNGGNATGATGGSGAVTVTTNYYRAISGSTGGNGAAAAGSAGFSLSSVSTVRTPAAISPKLGGSGGSGSGGAGGTSPVSTIGDRNIPYAPVPNPILASIDSIGSTVIQVAGFSGVGAGGGGGNGAQSGGGGGAGGSCGSGLYIGARNIIRLNSPTAPCIFLSGGNGGTGAAGTANDCGGGGGGGGGSAGYLGFVYEIIDSNSVTDFIKLQGGTGGDGGASGGGVGVAGLGGTGGDSGRYQIMNIGAGTVTTSLIGGNIGAPVTSTGSAGFSLTLTL